jgi:hypothetical protein
VAALAFLLPVVKALWKYIAIIVALLALYFYVHSKLVDWADARSAPKIAAAKAEASAARAALSAYQEQQRTRAAQLVLDWSAARDRAEQAEKELASERARKVEDIQARVRPAAGSSADIRLPPSLVGVLNESIAAANSTQAAGPSPVPGEDPAAVTLADLAEAKTTCDAYYGDAVAQILGLQKFYHDIQGATNAQPPL